MISQDAKDIQLPRPVLKGQMSLEETMQIRRSKRSFEDKELALEQIGQLMWAAQGITAEKDGIKYLTSPSPGALYPMEIYLIAGNGVFHYLKEGHRLEQINNLDIRPVLSSAALGHEAISEAPVSILICAVFERLQPQYGQRGLNYTNMEAGHIAQNIQLQAVSLGLGSVPIGAFNNEDIKQIIPLPEDHEPIYIVPVGTPRG